MSETTAQALDVDTVEVVEGLRKLAACIETNPHLTQHVKVHLSRILVAVWTREDIAAFARAGARHGTVTKHANGDWAGVDVAFSPAVGLHVYAGRDAVCERIVTGTHEVTEEVPDPELLAQVPVVTRTRTVEDVEWRCAPFLADGSV